jgi:GcrA cell cycle regulator
MRKSEFDWTEKRMATLRQMWSEGVSTAEIGRHLGVSKSAVVGKAKRIGCESRPSPIRQRDGSAYVKRIKRAPGVMLALDNSGTIPVADNPPQPGDALNVISYPNFLASQWPRSVRKCEWRDGITRFAYIQCTEHALPQKPYCEQHCALAYIPVRTSA